MQRGKNDVDTECKLQASRDRDITPVVIRMTHVYTKKWTGARMTSHQRSRVLLADFARASCLADKLHVYFYRTIAVEVIELTHYH